MGSTFDFGKRTDVSEPEKKVETWGKHRAYEFGTALAAPHKLLYLCKSGSRLHGTDTETSDYDFKGVFLPNKEDCYLGEAPNRLAYSSGDDKTKNTNEDVDFELWSVQEWLNLMSKGDSNALSVLFSAHNIEMVMYCDVMMTEILQNHYKLYNANDVEGFTGFAKSQAVKYGLKGSNLQVVENVLEYMDEVNLREPFNEKTRLGDMDLDELVELCHTDVSKNKEYLGLEKDDKGRYFLKVLTKKYQDTMYMYDFRDRMEKERDKYGKRAKEAKDMNGNDWKALSHSLRTLFEANEMLSKGFVNYPLNSSDLLKKVKEGEVSFDEFEEAYGSMRKMVDDLASSNPQTNRLDKNAQRQMVLNLYRKDSGDEQRTD